jgi:hypothetical protein
MKIIFNKNNRMRLKVALLLSIVIQTISLSQSVQFTYSQNKNIVRKEVDIDKKEFSINGDSIVCKGKTVEYAISSNETARWSNGTNGVKASYTITRDTVIKAVITNKYDCDYEQTFSIKAADIPVKPVIQRSGDSLIVYNVSGHFEWYRNGQLFSVGLNFIRTSLTGDYTVRVTDTNGCDNTSDVFPFVITSTESSLGSDLNIFPNPTSGFLNIQYTGSKIEDFKFSLFASDGKEYPVSLDGFKIDISGYPNGVYHLICKTSNKNYRYKIVKIE